MEYGLRTVEWVAFSKIKAIIEYSRSLNNEPVYWGGSRYLSEIMPECKHTCAKILEQLVEKGALLKFYSVVGNDLQWSQIYYLARDYPEDKPHPLEGTIHEISSRPSPDKVANLAVIRPVYQKMLHLLPKKRIAPMWKTVQGVYHNLKTPS